MGGDGGVIAAKREYMQSCGDVFGMKGGMAKTKLNRTETAELRTKVCAISNERLREPVAACELGYLFNKDTLLSGLLERNLNSAFGHIRGLKDIVECRLTPNPAFEKEGRAMEGPEPSRFMCPVTLQEMNGAHAFVVLFSTGWVMADKAIKEVGVDSLQEEYGPFTAEDVIPLAPTDEEREAATRALLAKRELARAAKSAKKASKKSARREKSATAAAISSSSSSRRPASGDANVSLVQDKGESEQGGKGDGEMQGAAEHAARSEHKRNKKRRKAERDAAAAAAVERGGASAGPESAKLAGAAAQAVQKNKESSAVYASLFGKKNVSNEHLFIATAGHRYNLG